MDTALAVIARPIMLFLFILAIGYPVRYLVRRFMKDCKLKRVLLFELY